MPEVSIVIPLYNKGPYIARALNSVLSQTFQDFEVIIVDGGSTDNGTDIVRRLRDPRIRLIQQKDKGVSEARNQGIDEAKAELIAFLDADDEWLPEFIDTILQLRALFPHAGLYGTAYEVHFPGSIVQRVYIKSEGERLLPSYFGALVTLGSLLYISSSFAAPKYVLMGVGGFPVGVKWNEDGTLFGIIALKFPVAYSPKICSIYHQYTANNSMNITTYLENPFIQYISTIPNDKLLKRDDAGDLIEYRDLCHLATISRNIFSGYGTRARLELLSVTSPRYALKKYKLLFFSFIPLSIMRIIRNHAKTLSYLKRKILRT